MVAFGHSSVGAIIGVAGTVAFAPSTPVWLKLIIILMVAIASHYATDAIPHGHYGEDVTKLTRAENVIFWLDTVGAFWLLLIVAAAVAGLGEAVALVATGMVGALLPDIWEGLVAFKVIPNSSFAKKHRHFHYYTVHWHRYSGPQLRGRRIRAWSITDIWQVAVLLTAILIILTIPAA